MFSVGVGVLMLMGLGFTVVAVPFVIVYAAFRGLAAIAWVFGGIFGFFGRVISGTARGTGGIFAHVFQYGRGMLLDSLRMIGGILTAAFLLPLLLFNLAMLRVGTARHYANAMEDELLAVALGGYRVCIGHTARFLGLSALTEGFERRIPDVIARAPGITAVAGPIQKGNTKAFEGYKVVGKLRTGGSGGRLYLAEPDKNKLSLLERGRRSFKKASLNDLSIDRVVIKSFALEDGSTLPQIVRESRALEAAKQLGLVLEHELTPVRFHYVMPYVNGDELNVVVRRMHDASGAAGLAERHVENTLAYCSQLLETLQRFHEAGLWHKDIKPSNIIVAGGVAHLVDLGLVTPLQSAMTLTTHGTEYFRDPDMVRLAMRGVKVHEVDGVKFDLYSTGAVMYAAIENSFPAHGSLSRISKRCPEALAWIVRRAMADMNSRYSSAGEMSRDLRVLQEADDAFAVRPADLPSFQGVPFTPEQHRVDPFARPASLEVESQRAEHLVSIKSDPEPSFDQEGSPFPSPATVEEPQRRSMFKKRAKKAAAAAGAAAAVAAESAKSAANTTRDFANNTRDFIGENIRKAKEPKLTRKEKRALKKAARAQAAASPRRRRVRRVVAGFGVVAAIVGGSLIGFTELEYRDQQRRREARQERDVAQSLAVSSVNSISDVLLEHGLHVQKSLARHPQLQAVWGSRSDRPTVLVLNDLKNDRLKLLPKTLQRLQSQQYRLLGLGDQELHEVELDILGRVRAEMELASLDDPGMIENIQNLVDEMAELDYVLWVTKEGANPYFNGALIGSGLSMRFGHDQHPKVDMGLPRMGHSQARFEFPFDHNFELEVGNGININIDNIFGTSNAQPHPIPVPREVPCPETPCNEKRSKTKSKRPF